jgi:hypothetical protein
MALRDFERGKPGLRLIEHPATQLGQRPLRVVHEGVPAVRGRKAFVFLRATLRPLTARARGEAHGIARLRSPRRTIPLRHPAAGQLLSALLEHGAGMARLVPQLRALGGGLPAQRRLLAG